jgi:hypothetical protein
LDTRKVVEELKQERARLERAIAALEGPVTTKNVVRKGLASTPLPIGHDAQKRGGMTPEGRKRVSLAMKKRWAERRKKGN